MSRTDCIKNYHKVQNFVILPSFGLTDGVLTNVGLRIGLLSGSSVFCHQQADVA